MIRLGKHIRLTRNEVQRFTTITGFEPLTVKSLDDLDAYIERCKRHYWGVSKDTQFLHWLMDKERLRCIGGRYPTSSGGKYSRPLLYVDGDGKVV